MAVSRRTMLSALPAMAGLSSLSPAVAVAQSAGDPLGVRQDFPVAATTLSLNAAYIAPTPLPVMAAGRAFAEAKGHAPIVLGDMLKRTDEVRAQYGRLINASPDEIAFLSATSEGENIVARSLDLGRGDNVVIDELHYETEFVLYSEMAKTTGVELRIAKAVGGAVTVKALEPLVNRRTKLVSVAWVSHQNGFRHDVRPIADLAHAHGAFCYTDAIQAVGMFPVDVQAAGVDAMCIGTYKWVLGSYGVAPFYVRRAVLPRLKVDRYGWRHVEKTLGPTDFQIYQSARKFDYATPAFGPIYQLGAGLDYITAVGLDRIEAHTVALAHRLQRGLRTLGFDVVTPEGNRTSIVAFRVTKPEEAIARHLADTRTSVSLRENGTQIRVSPALFNTDADIDRFLTVAEGLR
ncbi:MAG TPA: aminotransferase class V-fold PLP-dependent enzyme [Vicinamibacterales bacterium]|nr:aminotransferase class V-fold PLP-dependent enzyme [Vicinamibacterales bacterium]